MDEIQAYMKLYGGFVMFVPHYTKRLRMLRAFDRVVLEALTKRAKSAKRTHKWTQTENSNSTPSKSKA